MKAQNIRHHFRQDNLNHNFNFNFNLGSDRNRPTDLHPFINYHLVLNPHLDKYVNVSVSYALSDQISSIEYLNRLVYLPLESLTLQCIAIAVFSRISWQECQLPAHCGAIHAKLIESGYWTKSYLCIGVGQDLLVVESGVGRHLKFGLSWRQMINVSFVNQTGSLYLLHHPELGFSVAPIDIDEHNIILDVMTNDTIFPNLMRTHDDRYCMMMYTPMGINLMHGGPYGSVNQLIDDLKPPFIADNDSRLNATFRLDFVHVMNVVNGYAHQESALETYYVTCKPYDTTFIYSPISFSPITSVVGSMIDNVIAWLVLHIMRVVEYVMHVFHYIMNQFNVYAAIIYIIYSLIRRQTLLNAIILGVIVSHIIRVLQDAVFDTAQY